MSKTKTNPTMQDVAELAGVSKMTVSRSFNRDTSVKDETRKKILSAAESLGYVFDSTASVLRTRHSGFVALIVPSTSGLAFAETIGGVTDTLRPAGLEVLLGCSNYNPLEEERYVEHFLKRRPEAVILTGSDHTDRCRNMLKAADALVMETWSNPEDPIGGVVGFSNSEAAKIMVSYFISRGHQKIGFIGGDTMLDARGKSRRHGFQEALEEAGMDNSRMVALGAPPVTMRDGASACTELLARWPDTTAVMCVSDIPAFGALSECLRRGIKIPEDISIAGFGAYDLSEFSIPSLTTIDVSPRFIGEATGRQIEFILNSNDKRDIPAPILIEPRLVIRESA